MNSNLQKQFIFCKSPTYFSSSGFRPQDRLSSVPSLKGFLDFVHILCTSEDINNLAYGLMIHQTLQEVLIPNMQQIANELQRLAKEVTRPVKLYHFDG